MTPNLASNGVVSCLENCGLLDLSFGSYVTKGILNLAHDVYTDQTRNARSTLSDRQWGIVTVGHICTIIKQTLGSHSEASVIQGVRLRSSDCWTVVMQDFPNYEQSSITQLA